MKISIVTVAYNQSLYDIPWLDTALKNSNVYEIIVCDNSTLKNNNAAQATGLGVTYISMDGNKGLSVAYNRGISVCSGDVVCILDDDTEVPDCYFAAVAAQEESDWGICLPLVLEGQNILSPCLFDGYRAKPYRRQRDIHDTQQMSGINSGMAIRRKVFDDVSYDERLFLDLADHKFVLDVRAAGYAVRYLDGPILKQQYSFATDKAESAAARLAIFEHDAKVFLLPMLDLR